MDSGRQGYNIVVKKRVSSDLLFYYIVRPRMWTLFVIFTFVLIFVAIFGFVHRLFLTRFTNTFPPSTTETNDRKYTRKSSNKTNPRRRPPTRRKQFTFLLQIGTKDNTRPKWYPHMPFFSFERLLSICQSDQRKIYDEYFMQHANKVGTRNW